MGINSKTLRKLEDHTLQPVEEGSTKIDVNSLPEAEQELFDYLQKRKFDYENMTDQDKTLLLTAGHRLFVRSVDLLTDTSRQYFPSEDGKQFKTCLLMFILKYANAPTETRKQLIFDTILEM